MSHEPIIVCGQTVGVDKYLATDIEGLVIAQALQAYGFLLWSSDRVVRRYSFYDFADMIESNIDMKQSDTEMVRVLRTVQHRNEVGQNRLFIGVYPCGIFYADRLREKHGDYARLAFLPYDTLRLQVEADCPQELIPRIQADAEAMQSRCGEAFQISSCGQTVTLGRLVATK